MTCSKLDSQRCQLLCRFARCVCAVAAMILECRAGVSAAPLAEAPFLCLTHLSQQAAGFQDWVSVAKADFLGMTAQWELMAIDIDGMCKQTVLLLQSSMAASIAGWSDQAKVLAAEAKAVSPSRGLVENARVLADPDMQAMLSTATKQLHEPKLLSQVGDVLALLKKHEEKNAALRKLAGAWLWLLPVSWASWRLPLTSRWNR